MSTYASSGVAFVPSKTLFAINYLEVVSMQILKPIEEFVFRSVEIATGLQLASDEFNIRHLKQTIVTRMDIAHKYGLRGKN